MLDFIDDEHITVNTSVREIPEWFRHCCQQVIEYYNLTHFPGWELVKERTHLESYLNKMGFEYEYFEIRRHEAQGVQRGYVFKVNEALTLYMLKASK